MIVYLGKKPVGVTKIVKKEVAKTKFGASVDSFFGDVDADGVLQRPTGTLHLDFSGVKEIGQYALFGRFEEISTGQAGAIATTADFSSVEMVEAYGMAYIFCYANLVEVDVSNITRIASRGLFHAFESTDITQISFRGLVRVGGYGLGYVCSDCSYLEGVIDLGNLVEAEGYSMQDSFSGCGKITGYNFDSLQTVGTSAWNRVFMDNISLTALRFPSLISVATNSFGSSTSNGAFRGCTALTEIHFRADMQATIEAMSQYANKWGAPATCSILFDL